MSFARTPYYVRPQVSGSHVVQTLPRASDPILKGGVASEHPDSSLTSMGPRHAFPPFRMRLALGFLYVAFVMLSSVPIRHTFPGASIRKACCISLKAVYASIEMLLVQDDSFVEIFLRHFFLLLKTLF